MTFNEFKKFVFSEEMQTTITGSRWVIKAVKVPLKGDVVSVYTDEVANTTKNQEWFPNGFISGSPSMVLSVLANKRTGRIIMNNYHLRESLEDVPEDLEIAWRSLAKQTDEMLRQAALAEVEKGPLPELDELRESDAHFNAQSLYITGCEDVRDDDFVGLVTDVTMLNCFAEKSPKWAEIAAIAWLQADAYYGCGTNRKLIARRLAYDNRVQQLMAEYEADAKCSEHIRREMRDAVKNAGTKTVVVTFQCVDGTTSKTKMDADGFLRVYPYCDVDQISLGHISPTSESRRVALLLDESCRGLPVNAIQSITYKGKVVWTQKKECENMEQKEVLQNTLII